MKNYFQFACELEPIDRFPGCMSKDDLLENLLRQDRLNPAGVTCLRRTVPRFWSTPYRAGSCTACEKGGTS